MPRQIDPRVTSEISNNHISNIMQSDTMNTNSTT